MDLTKLPVWQKKFIDNMKIKKDDTVVVIAGKDKGQQGKVERVYKKSGKVLIPQINMYKKHMKKTEQMPQGGIVDIPRPLEVSNVMLVCPKCKKPARVGLEVVDGKKFRVCKKCNKRI